MTILPDPIDDLAAALDLDPSELNDETDLFEMGLDSLTVIRMTGVWRRAGLDVGFADLVEDPTPAGWRRALREAGGRRLLPSAPTVPDSAATAPATAAGADRDARAASPGSAAQDEAAQDEAVPFDLATLQHAYWVGRQDGQPFGGVAAHIYIELDGHDVDPQRLRAALRRITARHAMLRMRLTPHGQQWTAPASTADQADITVADLRDLAPAEVDARLEDTRQHLTHRRMEVERGHVLDLRLSLLPQRATRLHLDLDMIAADAMSLRVLVADLARAYADPAWDAPAPASSYRQYLTAGPDPARQTDRRWWAQQAPDLPDGPQLPLRPEAGDPRTKARSVRFHHWAGPAETAALTRAAAAHGVTLAAALAAAFAESLGGWSQQPRFLLNLPLFNRRPILPEVDDLIGDFSSSVLLPVDVSGEVPFSRRAEQVRSDLHAAVGHGSYGGVEVLRDLARLRGGTVLAPVVYTSAVGLGEIYGPAVRECFGETVWTISQGPQVWLDAQVTEHDGGLLLNWDVRLDVLREDAARAAFDAYRRLVTALGADPDAWDRPAAPPLPAAQAQARTVLDASSSARQPRLLHGTFVDQAGRDPQRTALILADRTVSYGELLALARAVADRLTEAGARPGDSVVITLPKGATQVVAAIGVLLAGCTYVPVGVDQPPARRARIHAAAGARLALSDPEHAAAVRQAGAEVLELGLPDTTPTDTAPTDRTTTDRSTTGSGDATGPAGPAAPTDLAYVLFTSGSTGEPKGVEIPHAAAANTIDTLNDRFGIGAQDRVLTVSALEFDLSVYDVFGLLSAGGALVVLDQADRADPGAWHRAVCEHGVTVWNTVPPVFDLLLRAAEAEGTELPLRTVLLGGDRVSGDLPGRLHTLAARARFAALGGMTEAAIHSTVFELRAGDPVDPAATSLPWGLPLDGVACRVVDEAGRDRPDDVVGELWMGGAGLARGYRADPHRSAERFVEQDGRRWYRTGDLALVRAGLGLEFAGRADHQVKVSGHRIELGEIEAVLTAHPRVRAAAVQPVTTAATGVQLAALVALNAPETAAAQEEPDLHGWLAEQLPAHMRCAWFTVVEGGAGLPLNHNGKVDRAAIGRLLLGAAQQRSGSGGAPPRTEVERRVADAWSQLLGTERISRDDDFFALGGDSLLATRLLVVLERSGVRGASLGAVFARPRLADLCVDLVLTGLGADGESANEPANELDRVTGGGPAHRHEPFALTDVQRAYLIGRDPQLPLGGVGTWQYNEFDGPVMDLERLQTAWDRVRDRHDMLRAVVEGETQRVPADPAPVRIRHTDATADADPAPALAGLRERLSHRLVDLAAGPLVEIEAVTYRTDGQLRTRLGIGYDYIVLDALSIMRVLTELDRCYVDPETDLGPVGPSFRDYVLARAGDEPDPAHLKHWEQRLAELPPAPELPLLRSPSQVSGPRFERRQRLLAPATWQALQDRARALRVTVPSVLFAAYGEVLSTWSGAEGVTLTLTRFDRQPVHPQIDRVVGDFTSLSPAGYRRAARTSFAEAVRGVHRRTGEDLDHSRVPASWLLRRLASAGGDGQPVPVVFTSAVGVGGQVSMDRSAEFGQPVWGLSQSPQVCLDCQVQPYQDGLQVTWDSVQGMLREAVLDDMFAAYLGLLEWLAEHGWDEALPDLLPDRQRQVRTRVAATGAGGPATDLLTPILRRADEQPDRPALVAAGEPGAPTVSYAQLGADIERWVGLLGEAGIGRGEKVAISLDKGPAQVGAVLGILAAGAAYVPVPRSAPAVRREALYRLAGTRAVIADPDLPLPAHLIRLDPTELATAPRRDRLTAAPDDLAYVIFTSGSTGEPKGVQITHDAAANTCRDIADRYRITAEDRVLGLSALEFDLSVFDIFGVLGAGGTLVLPAEQERRDPGDWLAQVRAHRVTLWNSVPALLDLLLAQAGAAGLPESFRLALVSGDWVGLDLADRLREATGDRAQLVALGGATEAAIWSNAFDVTEVDAGWHSVPYGFALAGQRYRVVDPAGRDAPENVPGELWIGGRGVALGYLGDAERTADRFVEADGERWYRTGDLGRFWPDGTLEFLGRTDHQVKINGHRLELGEVEAALESLPGVHRAVVVAPGPRGRRTLHAVLEPLGADPEQLRRALRELLPAHAVPARISVVEALPLTANGKIDRGALLDLAPAPEPGSAAAGTLSRTEAELAPLWSAATGSTEIDPQEGFFAAGGDSLAALRLVAAVRDQLQVPISARDLFAAPTLAALARQVEATRQQIGEEVDEGVL